MQLLLRALAKFSDAHLWWGSGKPSEHWQPPAGGGSKFPLLEWELDLMTHFQRTECAMENPARYNHNQWSRSHPPWQITVISCTGGYHVTRRALLCCGILPKTHNLHLIMRKKSYKLKLSDVSAKYLTRTLQNCSVLDKQGKTEYLSRFRD